MSTDTLHPLPRRADVAREQFLAAGLALRAPAVWITAFLAAVTLLFLCLWLDALRDASTTMSVNLGPGVGVPAALLALLVPMAVWRSEEPARRTYLLSMPVEREWHQLARSTGGWAWVMLAVAAYLLWLVSLALITGSEIGIVQELVFNGQTSQIDGVRFGTVRAGEFHRMTFEMPGWQWGVPFVAATAAYLLGSTAALVSNHPWRWVGGAVAAYFLLVALTQALDRPLLQSALDSIYQGRYGIQTLLTGMVATVEQFASRSGGTFEAAVQRPNLQAWLVSALIWLGLGVVGTLIAGTRHREP